MSDYYKGYRVPKILIGYAVRYYFRYKLSLRDVQDIMLDRGLSVSHQSISDWIRDLGSLYAQAIRKTRGRSQSDKWHIDEMRTKVNGEVFWLWRLVDEQGEEIEVLLQKRRNAKCAIRFLKNALKRVGSIPRVLISDKLKSYPKAHKVLMKSCEHRSHKGLNNRAENSHQPTREKERQMRGFKRVGSTQRLLTSQGQVLNLFKIGRYKNTAQVYRQKLQHAHTIFDHIVLNTLPHA